MDIHRTPDGMIYTVTTTRVYGKDVRIASYRDDNNWPQLIEDHRHNLHNAEIIYHKTKQMHKEIVSGQNSTTGDWPEDMKKHSQKWLDKYGFTD